MDFVNNELDIGNSFAKAISCIPQVTLREPNLTGEGVIVAVLDSGERVKLMSRNSDISPKIRASCHRIIDKKRY